MRRVLVLIHTPLFGGPHNQMIRLYAPLQARGWETLVILPTEPGSGAERLAAAGVPFLKIPLHRLRAKWSLPIQRDFLCGFLPEVAHIRQIIRENRIDVVQICGLMHPHGAVAAHMEHIPVVWQLMGTFAPMPLRMLLMPLVVRMADVIMSTGMHVAYAHPGATSMGCRMIPYTPPVDTNLFRPSPAQRARARAELGVPDDAYLIGTVGNFGLPKAHEFLVQAAAIIRKNHPQSYFRLLGAHTPNHARYYETMVIQEARTLGLLEDDVLRFVEPGQRVADLLPAFDIFLLTSRQEGVPTAILEAMSCGLPVVATDVGSVREIVEHGVTGFLVPSGDVDMIARATMKLLEYPALAAQMSRLARQRAVEKYDTHACVSTHIRAYEKALSHHTLSLAHVPDTQKPPSAG